MPNCPIDMEVDGEGCRWSDRDADGVLDNKDLCADLPEDTDNHQDEDGCPDPDNDEDGVCDAEASATEDVSCSGLDQCPSEPEDLDGWLDEDGCPDPDNDADQFADIDDACPNEAASAESEDGCPVEAVAVIAQPLPPKTDLMPWVWGAGGAGVLLGGASLGLHLWAESVRDEVVGAPTDDQGRVLDLTEIEADHLEEKANIIDSVALGSAVVGSAALVTSLVLYLLDDSDSHGSETLEVWLVPTGSSLTLRLRF